ncbi:hypothetical protein M0805_009412 [Coniferiporia weirii]|nr:hypothetical protein M0805_009412 [Coniferiporia weirii]
MPQPIATTSSSSKKRKHVEVNVNDAGAVHKKAKKDGKEHKKKATKDGQFQVVSASVVVSIPPRFAMDPMAGAREMLDSLIMRYVPALKGVMLCHTDVRFLSEVAIIKQECPFLNCIVGFDATVWSPQIGMKLSGKINLYSPDHVSLLVHQTFNVSIPRHHIPSENWQFEYGAAENDPEFGPNAAAFEETEMDAMKVDGEGPDDPKSSNEESTGVWVHKITTDKLGGAEGRLEFTVIGLTVANQMLSLVGSVQPDPFSPEHVPQPAIATNVSAPTYDEEDGEEEHGLEQHDQLDDSDEEDPFSHLGQARQEATEMAATEKLAKAREKEERKKRKREKKEKKEKRKAEKAAEPGGKLEDAPTKTEKPAKKKRKHATQEG